MGFVLPGDDTSVKESSVTSCITNEVQKRRNDQLVKLNRHFPESIAQDLALLRRLATDSSRDEQTEIVTP